MQFIFVTTVLGPHRTDSWKLYWSQLLSIAEHWTQRHRQKIISLQISKWMSEFSGTGYDERWAGRVLESNMSQPILSLYLRELKIDTYKNLAFSEPYKYTVN